MTFNFIDLQNIQFRRLIEKGKVTITEERNQVQICAKRTVEIQYSEDFKLLFIAAVSYLIAVVAAISSKRWFIINHRLGLSVISKIAQLQFVTTNQI